MRVVINGQEFDLGGSGVTMEEVRQEIGIPIKKALTKAEYDALSEDEKMADVAYIVTDDDGDGIAIEDVEGLPEALAGKQDKLTGSQGQVVGFDAAGNPVATAAPSGGGGLTLEEADERYIRPGGQYPDAGYTRLGSFAFGDDSVLTIYDSASGRSADLSFSAVLDNSGANVRISAVAPPAYPYDAANKQYVDDTIAAAISGAIEEVYYGTSAETSV